MTAQQTPDNFLGIPEISAEDADVLVLPIPLEMTVSYGSGTKNGPRAILEASKQVELYDHELHDEVTNKVKIATLPEVKFGNANPEEAQMTIYKAVKPWVNKFVLSFGGEHAITPALVKAYQEKYADLSILYFDAHTDMRDQWEGSKWSHACAARRCQEQLASAGASRSGGIERIVWVGIRNTAQEEQQYINQDFVNYGNKYDLKKILRQLGKNVYLSFDIDAFDVSTMPATGTPEPGGINWGQAMEIFEAVAREKNIVGADINELAPIPGFHGYDFLAAKLGFKLIGYKFRRK